MPLLIEQILRIIGSAIAGAIVGYEREIKNKPAGFLTFTLVCVGSCIIAILQQNIVSEYPNADPSRIIAQVVSGVGFLGAGTILYKRGNVQGITTAAMLWLVAGLGLLIGTGGSLNYAIAATTVIIVFPIIIVSRSLSIKLTQTRKIHKLRIVFDDQFEKELYDTFASLGITIRKSYLLNKHFHDKIHLKETLIYLSLPKGTNVMELVKNICAFEYVHEIEEE